MNLTDLIRPLFRSALTGGGTGALDAIVTAGVLTPPVPAIVCTGGNVYIYQLISGTNATSSPNYIRPTDYNGVSNQKVWQLQSVAISSLPGLFDLKGAWDANANSPALASGVGTKGDVYIVSTSGTTNLDGETGWTAKDWAFFDGTKWARVDNTDQDATSSIKGVLQLTQDLGGTAAAPVVKQSSQDFAFSGQISATVSASQNDWAPTGIASANWIRITQSGIGSYNITGISGGAKGRFLIIEMVSVTAGITFQNQNTGSSAANRIITPSGADFKPSAGESFIIYYDDVQSRWVVMGRNFVDYTGDITSSSGVPKVSGSSVNFGFKGGLSPTQITSDQNNYAPTGLDTCNMLRLDLDADRHITGLQMTGGIGPVICLHNISSHNLILDHESASSTASNRFHLGGSNLTIPSECAVFLQKDTTSNRWRVFGAGLYLPIGGGTLTGRLTLSGPVTNTPAAVTFSSTTNIDFNGNPVQTITVTGSLTLTTSNLAAGALQKVFLIDDGLGPHSLTFPGWKVFGAALPSATVASKVIILSLESTGTTDANVYATAVSQV